MHCISIRALHVSVSFICSSLSTLDGGRVWSVVLTQLRGIFLLEDVHCHRSCRFWTVYSRIMTSFKQTRLLSCNLFLYERSMYPFHSSVTSQTHMPQLHPPSPVRHFHLTTLQTRPPSSVDGELQMNETDTWSARIEIQCMTASGSA